MADYMNMSDPRDRPNYPASPMNMGPAPAGPVAPGKFDPNWMPDYGDGAPLPGHPDYIQGYDPKTMSLTDYLTGAYNHQGYDKFKQEAMRKGPSQWSTLAKADQLAQASGQREKGAAESSGQTARAMDELASRGGLSSGARERAATEGSKNYLAMTQGIDRQANLNGMQIGMNDEQNRIQQLSQIPGMEQSQAEMWEKAKGQDIANTTAENDKRNMYNQSVYGKQMDAWGTNRMADATIKSKK